MTVPSAAQSLSDKPRFKKGRAVRALLSASALALVLAGCQVSEFAHEAAHLAPIPAGLDRKIDRMGMRAGSPILLRIYKEESALEVWKEDKSGRFQLLKEYEICAWSGELGPKIKEGDRQAPEGFYHVTPGLMNPNSSYHLAFNLGFPNAFDRSHGRTGSHLMVHGDCSSRGCYAMEDDQIEEIYALAREAFRGGQRAFQVQAFPFKMTPENMAKHADSEHLPFWEMLKRGSDHFEVTRQVPRVDVCGRQYVFNATPETGAFSARTECPAYDVRDDVEQLVAAKWDADLKRRGTVIARNAARDEREQRWEDREQAIAAFFDRGGREEDTAEPAPLSETEATALAVAGVPVPRSAPGDRGNGRAATEGVGFRLPNPFARRDEPVASVAGVVEEAETVSPTAPSSTATSVAQAPASPRPQAAETGVTPTEPLAYAPAEKDTGFFASMAEGSRGLFRKAGAIFK
ncbi:MAG: L,D-transpeptidase family protein [Pseudomonadota bacterium]